MCLADLKNREKKVTQAKLAEELGVTEQAVGKWKKSGQIEAATISEICKKYNFPPPEWLQIQTLGMVTDTETTLPLQNELDKRLSNYLDTLLQGDPKTSSRIQELLQKFQGLTNSAQIHVLDKAIQEAESMQKIQEEAISGTQARENLRQKQRTQHGRKKPG